MTERISSQHLRHLRNDISIHDVIELYLEIPTKFREGFQRFICPVCAEFNTAINPATNLARCFACSRNFNTIEIVMATRKCSFLNAITLLQEFKNRQANQQQIIAKLIGNIARAK